MIPLPNKPSSSAQPRAKPGGEIAPNGEFYPGGKFIATTDRSKQHKSPRGSSRRVQIEHGVWVEEMEGFLPLWGSLAGVEIPNRTNWTFSFNDSLRLHYAEPAAVLQRRRDIDAWNVGMRWRSTSNRNAYS